MFLTIEEEVFLVATHFIGSGEVFIYHDTLLELALKTSYSMPPWCALRPSKAEHCARAAAKQPTRKEISRQTAQRNAASAAGRRAAYAKLRRLTGNPWPGPGTSPDGPAATARP